MGGLVGWFWVKRPFETVFQSISGCHPKEGERVKKGQMTVKMSKQPPTRTDCKRSRPLPYYNPNCRTPRHWQFTQHHRTTRPLLYAVGSGHLIGTEAALFVQSRLIYTTPVSKSQSVSTVDSRYLEVEGTLKMCRTEENTNRTTKFLK